MTAPEATLILDALTSLNAVNTWIQGANPPNQPQTTATDLLTGLINSASRMVLSYLARPTLRQHAVTEVRSGVNGNRLLLRQYPIIGDLTALQIGNVIVPKRPPYSGSTQTPVTFFSFPGPSGWVIEDPWDGFSPWKPQTIAVTGFNFYRGSANIQIAYNAGYVVQNEAQTVPTGGGTLYPQQPLGAFASDVGVTYANGTPLTAVASSPATGQYVPPQAFQNPAQGYLFAAGDAAAGVLLSYSYVPAEIGYAVTKWVGEFSSYRSRIGQRTRSLGGNETASYDLTAMPLDVQLTLNAFKRKIPLF